MKITKKAINDFIVWSTSRYNDYLGFGTKKENVRLIHKSLIDGFYTDGSTVFQVECATGNGEGYGNRYWRLKGNRKSTDWKWEVDCVNKKITGLQSGNVLQFE